MYQVVQDLNKGGFLLSSGILYRFVRNEFIKTIPNPIIRPSISPNRTFLIRVPITSPITIAIRKAISPRLISIKGFFFSIFYLFVRRQQRLIILYKCNPISAGMAQLPNTTVIILPLSGGYISLTTYIVSRLCQPRPTISRFPYQLLPTSPTQLS